MIPTKFDRLQDVYRTLVNQENPRFPRTIGEAARILDLPIGEVEQQADLLLQIGCLTEIEDRQSAYRLFRRVPLATREVSA